MDENCKNVWTLGIYIQVPNNEKNFVLIQGKFSLISFRIYKNFVLKQFAFCWRRCTALKRANDWIIFNDWAGGWLIEYSVGPWKGILIHALELSWNKINDGP